MSNVQASQAISDAWTKALASYQRNLNPQQLQAVQTPTSPQDIVAHMETLEKDRASSRSGKIIDRVKSVADRLVRFSKVVDTMTTSNAEASLIWGSLKLLLTIVHQSAEVYEKICQSLIIVGESLPVVELIAETFVHSDLVNKYVVEYYCSILHFWRKALTYYRRHKIVIFLRGVWHDYKSEFGDFEDRMNRLREEVKTAALAVDMSEAMKARQQQEKNYLDSVEISRVINEANRHRKIVEWLAPPAREASYYVEDFRSSLKDRHPGTCEWILKKSEFQQWYHSQGADPTARILWVSAIAGAGKTVLSAFIINHCQESSTTGSVLYFFFKNTDDEKNSNLSMTRSLLHQLYVSRGTEDLKDDLLALKDDSGKDRFLSDERAWEMFLKHIKKAPGLIIVLDALDECRSYDIDKLLDRICQLAEIRVFVTSRREDIIYKKLKIYSCINIQQEDVDADITCFANAKVEKITRLSSFLRRRIIDTLSSGHGGMFLWVFLMIKELKSLATVKEVEERLSAIPQGLKGLHRAIILRLSKTLSDSELNIALKVLRWVVLAVRPLRLSEIREILQFEIKQDADDDDLLYSEKDLELICGSLVTTRNGVLQLIHLSTKEIIQERPEDMLPEDKCWSFYVDMRKISPQVANLCVSYMNSRQKNVDSYTRPGLTPVSRLESYRGNFDESRIVKDAPFIDYACNCWQAHLIDGELDGDIVCKLSRLLTYRFTILWVEFRLAQDSLSRWRLERSCRAMEDWLIEAPVITDAEIEKNVAFIRAWCGAVLGLFKKHGGLIKDFPDELHFLDIGPIFSSPDLVGFQPMAKEKTRERHICLLSLENPSISVEANRLLRQRSADMVTGLAICVYDETRDVFYYSDKFLRTGSATLWAQDRRTGRCLDPVEAEIEIDRPHSAFTLISSVLSFDRKYLAALYSGYRITFERVYGTLITSIWAIESDLNFRDIKQRKPWARRLQFLSTEDLGFSKACYPLAPGQDGLFCTPSGLVDPHGGIRHPLPGNLIKDRYPKKGNRSLTFSGDGQVLFNVDGPNEQIDKMSWLEPEIPIETISLSSLGLLSSDGGFNNKHIKDEFQINAITDDGNYIVFHRVQYHVAEIERKRRRTYLMETCNCYRSVLLFEEATDTNYRFCRFFRFWNGSLLALSHNIKSTLPDVPEGDTDNEDFFVYRWVDIIQRFLGHQELELPAKTSLNIKMKRYYFGDSDSASQPVKGSTTAFFILGGRLRFEVDLQNLTVNPTSVWERDVITVAERFLHTQVSRDGRYVGCVWRNTDANKREVSVQIIDLSLSRNNPNTSRNLTLVEDGSHYKFSPDLSILWGGSHCYDLSVATSEMPMTPFSCPTWGFSTSASELLPDTGILFCPRNRYLCIILRFDFKVFEIRRSTNTLLELRVRGIGFDRNSDEGDYKSGAFHPSLPFLLIFGLLPEDDGLSAKTNSQAIEIDLLTFQTTKVPLPSTFYTGSMHTVPHFAFSDSGRSVWLMHTEYVNVKWYLIQKSYLVTGGGLAPKTFEFLRHSLTDDRKTYRLLAGGSHIVLDHNGKLGGAVVMQVGEDDVAMVRITSCPEDAVNRRFCLLSGQKEDEPAQVLFKTKDGALYLRVLTVTMKEILDKLDELAEKNHRNQSIQETSIPGSKSLSGSAAEMSSKSASEASPGS